MVTSAKAKANKLAYDLAYQKRPGQVENRAARNKARADYEKKHGDLPSNVEVDHRVPLKAGGSTAATNTRAIPEKRNAGWRKGQSGYKPKKV